MNSARKHKIGWANRVTLARLLLIGPFVVCLLNQNDAASTAYRQAAILIFALMAFSDLLDGYLARRLHDESPLGAFLDPLADKILVTFAIIILCIMGVVDRAAASPRELHIPNWVVVAAIGKDLLVSLGFFVIYISTGTVLLRPRRLGKWCTTFELALVLAMLFWPNLPPALSDVPRILWFAAAVLAILAALDYIREGNHYIMTTLASRR